MTTGIYKTSGGARILRARYRELLDERPVTSEHVTVPTREGETFVVASGPSDAPALVLLHGSGANSAMWLGDVGAWSEQFRVCAVDLIGEPGLSAASRPTLTSDAYATWLDDVLTALGLDSAAFVGVSLGGWLALDYASRRPERVRSLAVMAPSGLGRQRFGVLVAAGLLLSLGSGGRRTAMRLVLGPASAETARAAERFGAYALLVHQHFRPRLGRVPPLSVEALQQLTMPVLVIVGGRDRLLDSHGTVRRFERSAPQVTVRLLPEAGHLLPSQTVAILDFLRTTESARPQS